MKKLTIKALKQILDNNYMIKNYVGVLKDSDTFYVVYRDKVVTYRYSKNVMWCMSINGNTLYGDAKAFTNLIPFLDEKYKGDVKND